MKSRKGKGFRLDLGDRLEAQFAAFKATYNFKSKTDIVREALIAHMEKELDADRERRRRFHQIMAGGGAKRANVVRLSKAKTDRSD